MDLLVEPARSGEPTCRSGSLQIHSPYDPRREADRFIESRLGSSRPACIVLLGPCLGYIADSLRARLSGAAIASVQYSGFFRGKEISAQGPCWYPDSPTPLHAFLDAAVDEDSISGVAVIEWPAAAAAFPEAAARCAAELRASLDRLASSAATVRTFGRRWLANACRSFLLIGKPVVLPRTELPIVIAAAGPSLRPSLDDLAPFRSSFILAAVSSAHASCRASGLEPDIVVTTDGGYWSRPHLYTLGEAAKAPSAPLAAPLTAFPWSRLWPSSPIALLDQGSFAEGQFLPLLGGGLTLPPHGSVVGTSLQLALRITEAPIVFAGLDLATLPGRGHARPHAFDYLDATRSSRLSCLESASLAECLVPGYSPIGRGPWLSTRSLAAYAGALAAEASAHPGRLFRLRPSHQDLPGFESIDRQRLRGLFGAPPTFRRGSRLPGLEAHRPAPALVPLVERAPLLRDRLRSWRKLCAETCAALSDSILPADPALRELLRSLDLPDWAAARRAVLAGADPSSAAAALAESAASFLADLERRLFP
jgi:hypothetical protein